MAASATFGFILYVPVFFRLRGNISVEGYKISFHRRIPSDVRFSRMRDGSLVVRGDGRGESYLDTVARHMLWYPVVYTFLILPTSASRLSTFSGKKPPFATAMLTSSVFMLHGFFNTILFCTTRRIIPESWRKRFGLRTMWGSRRGGTNRSSPTSTACQFTLASTTTAGVSPSDLEDAGIKDAAALNSLCLGSGSRPSSASPTIPTLPFQTHGANAHEHHIQRSSSARRETRASIPSDVGVDDRDSDLGLNLDSMEMTEEGEAPQRPGRASSDHQSGGHGPAVV
jgi:hypothetical protein